MKALSGYAEWFWLIARGWKDIENRNWSLPYEMAIYLPCRIYLHCSKRPASREELILISTLLSPAQLAEFAAVDWAELRGRIIGETTITRQMQMKSYKESDHVSLGCQQTELKLLEHDACRSRWFFGKFGFVCSDSVLYDKPIPWKGKLRFFEVELSV